MKTWTTTPTSYSTVKSAEIALAKLKNEYKDEPYFYLLSWKISKMPFDRYIGKAEVDEKNVCFECGDIMTDMQTNHGTPEMPVCNLCSFSQDL